MKLKLACLHELTDDQRRQLVTDFVREQFQRKGMVADVAIHERRSTATSGIITRTFCSPSGEIGPEGFGDKVREWNSREQLHDWREAWRERRTVIWNGTATKLGSTAANARSQGIDREPTTHRGVFAEGMERKGVETERGNIYRDTVERNGALSTFRRFEN